MIKRYKATQENTITNAYMENLTTRGTGSNMGASDILEVFTIFGQVSNSSGYSREEERFLIKFDISSLSSDRTAGVVPSGSAYFLKLFNAKHVQTVPRDLTLEVLALSQSWQEGIGLDMDTYKDLTYDVIGSNWIMSSGSNKWQTQLGGEAGLADTTGGSFHTSPIFTAYLPTGLEDLEVNITPLVNQWLGGAKQNYGVGIRVSSSLSALSRSYYTKKFYGRDSHRFFDRPYIEARWDSSARDDRGQFYSSSSWVTKADNLNTLYLYNYNRYGKLQDINWQEGADGKPYVWIYDDLTGSQLTTYPKTPVTGGKHSTGVYTASVCVQSTASLLYDVWKDDSGLEAHTGSFAPKTISRKSYSPTPKYVWTVSNRNTDYEYEQTYRIRLYVRDKNWSPNIYNTATTVPPPIIFNSASYQVYRIVDDRVVIGYGTGSHNETRLSYDVSGSYFDLDTSVLQPNYSYGINFSVYNDDTKSYVQQDYVYKFRVVNNEY